MDWRRTDESISGKIRKGSPGKEVGVAWACDENR